MSVWLVCQKIISATKDSIGNILNLKHNNNTVLVLWVIEISAVCPIRYY